MKEQFNPHVKVEMTKLAVMLAKADIPFELVAWNCMDDATIQIASPSKENCRIDAICHQFSYGGPEGFLEIMTSEKVAGVDDGVIGWLTAEQAFEYFRKAMV